MPEDYSKARTLATVDHLGTTFRVVRRRLDGKHWRGYLELLCDNTPMTTNDPKCGCPLAAAAEWKSRLERTFPPGSESKMTAVIAGLKNKG